MHANLFTLETGREQDAVFDERVPWRDRVRAAFAILDAAPPRDLPGSWGRASGDGCS
jgi:hypothetical protein